MAKNKGKPSGIYAQDKTSPGRKAITSGRVGLKTRPHNTSSPPAGNKRADGALARIATSFVWAVDGIARPVADNDASSQTNM